MGGKAIVRMSDFTASRALISDSGGDIAVSGVTTTELDILDGLTATTAELNIMDGVTATTAELNYVDGVTSAIQTQIDSKQATITGAATTIDDANLTASRAVISNASGKVAVSAVTDTELGYLDGVTSAVQTQIDGKQATITGAASSITSSNLTALRSLYSDASGKVAASSITATELSYLGGVTSAIQTQLDGKLSTGGGTLTGSLNVGSGNQLFTNTVTEASSGSGVTIDSVLLKDDTVTADSHFISGGSGSHWEIVKSGTSLIIKNGSTSLMKLDTSGNLTVTGDIITNGTGS
jgi:hypothetical protein